MVIIIGFNYSRPAQVAENLKIKPCRADKWNSAESGIFCRWWTSGTPARGLGHAWIEADVCAGRIAVPDSSRDYSLPVKEADINITTRDGVFSVVVNYRVPLDLLIYRPELEFRASGAGLVQ